MDDLKQILAKYYGMHGAVLTVLDGYANTNFRVDLPNGMKYVLKKYTAAPGLSEELQAENEILLSLAGGFYGKFSEPVKTLESNYLITIQESSETLYRLLHWVEGNFLYKETHTPALFDSLGNFVAKLNTALLAERHSVIKGKRSEWDLQRLLTLHDRLPLISDPNLRKQVHYFLLQFKEDVLSRLPSLRHSLIHNDVNDWNVLVTNEKVTGLIDFGDMVYGPLIQEVAVCLAYSMFGKEDPLKWASYILKSYTDEIDLEPQELDVLYFFVAGRLCMTLLNAAFSKAETPENEYIGVSELQAADLLDKWLEISPAKAANQFREACGITPEPVEEIEISLKRRFKHISSAQSVSYKAPIKMGRAAFQYMYDGYGNTFLDAYNNIPHVGHQHPKVVEAGQRQMARLNTNTRYVYDQLADYAEKLVGKFPEPLNKVFFVNSGSAASDLAIRMAQTYTANRRVMVLDHGYHGNTRLGIDISHYKFGGKGGKGQAEFILRAPIPDTYRGSFTQNDSSAGMAYAREAGDIISQSGDQVAAFIAEPIVGCAGQVPLAKDYLKNIYPIVRNQGGVCISDEVQTGFGRVGSKFWGFELQDVVPDIVVLGKPMGNGHPLAAVVTTDAIARSFDNGMEFFSSFGGNPVSCAIGMAVLEVLEEEGLQQNALETGTYFRNMLNELKDQYPRIGDVRGHGLFIGVEFVKDRHTKEYDPELAGLIKNRLRELFVLVSTDGPMNNITKMKPPLCFSKRNADLVVEKMAGILSSIGDR